jgi:hypothetical protein
VLDSYEVSGLRMSVVITTSSPYKDQWIHKAGLKIGVVSDW